MDYIIFYLKKYWFIAAGILIVILFMMNATSKETLNVYNTSTGDKEYTLESESEDSETVETETYKNPEINMTMEIPVGWEKITKDGYDTFFHAESASSIQIKILAYYPMVNNVNWDSLYESYLSLGFEMTEFQFTSDTSYYTIYQKAASSGIVDYIENVYWDRDHVVKIIATFSDANYERLQKTIWTSLDSFQWDRENSVQEGCFLSYRQDGDFEFAIPSSWITSSWAENDTGASFYAGDESGTQFMTVNVLYDSSYVSDINESDYGNFLMNGRQRFVLTEFQKSEDKIYGEATYMNNNVQMGLMQEYRANGMYHYIITYEFPTDNSEKIYRLAASALKMTRIFMDPVPQPETETEGLTLPNLKDKYESSFTFTPDAGSLGDTTSGTSDESVSSFADAIVSVASIPYEKALSISNTWEQIGLGNATYAEAYMQSGDNLIILITTDMMANYYLVISQAGDLLEIHANTPDGPTV